jgi:hypothetical protein
VFCSIPQQRQCFQRLEGLGLVRFCPISGQIQPDRASSMLAWWSVFCSIHQQRQGFQLLEGLGPVVGLSSARLIALGLPDFRTDSGFQVSAMWA